MDWASLSDALLSPEPYCHRLQLRAPGLTTLSSTWLPALKFAFALGFSQHLMQRDLNQSELAYLSASLVIRFLILTPIVQRKPAPRLPRY